MGEERVGSAVMMGRAVVIVVMLNFGRRMGMRDESSLFGCGRSGDVISERDKRRFVS